jgi:carotenoid cleavage dioxygenase-like enzyme
VFLSGNFRPVHEEIDRAGLKIEGAWPEALEGTLIQAGPNPAFAPLAGYHPFEGSGMLHAVRIEPGEASYRNRFVRTPDYVAERAAGRPLAPSLTAPPLLADLEAGRFPYRDAANAAVIRHAGKAWALGGFHAPIAVDPESLETLGRDEILGEDEAPFGGHTKRDPDSGEVFYFRSHVGPEPRLRVGAIDRCGRRVFERDVPLETPRLMHDFAVSKHHAVFIDAGVAFDAAHAARGGSGWTFDRSLSSRLLVVPRDGGAVRSFPIEPCVVVHALNAWESVDGRLLTFVALRYASVPEVLAFETATEGEPPRGGTDAGFLCAWMVDLRTGRVEERVLSKTPAEYPRQDEALLTRQTRRAWLAANLPRGAVVEVDLETGRERHIEHGRGRYGGEFVFVPRPEGAPEHGYLIGFVWDSRSGRSSVDVLDSDAPEAPPVARVLLPCRVPFGFHVTWLPRTREVAS